MLKVVISCLVLFAAPSFANDERSWHELIAAGEGTKPRATRLLDKDFKEKKGKTASEDEGAYINFYSSKANEYASKAATSIKGKDPKDAVRDPDYIAYRNFILYGKDINQHLEGVLLQTIVQYSTTNPELLKVIEFDPHPDIKDNFAQIYLGRLLVPDKKDEFYLGDVGKIMRILNKEEISKEIKWIEDNEDFSKTTNLCNPPFWLVARIVTGKKSYSKLEDKIKKFREDLDTQEKNNSNAAGRVKTHRDRCNIAEHIRKLSDEDIQKLNTDEEFAEAFWYKAFGHPEGDLNKDDRTLVAITSDKREILQVMTKSLLKEQNKEKISPTIKLQK